MKNRKGSVLIIVLVLVAVASAFTLFIISVSKNILFFSSALLDKLNTKIESKSAFEKLKFVLSTSSVGEISILNNSTLKGLPKEIYPYGKPFKIGNTTVSISDISGKLDVMFLKRLPLRELFGNLGFNYLDADIAYDSYLDWRDKDDLKHLNGAESYYYRAEKGYKYTPRNSSAIQDIEELKCIRGFMEKFKYLKPYLTFYYKGVLFNLNFASNETLSAFFGLSKDQIFQLNTIKKEKGKLTLSDINYVSGKNFNYLYDMLSTYPSKVFEIRLVTDGKYSKDKIKAVVDFNPSRDYPFKIIKYVE